MWVQTYHPCRWRLKGLLVIPICVKPSICCVLDVFLCDSLLMGAFGSCVATFIIDLHARAHLRLDYHIYVSLWTRPHCLRFSLFFIVLFNSFCRKRSPNLVCMTAGVKHIHSHSLLNRSWQLLESLCYCQPTRNNLHSFRSCIFNV